MFQQHQIIMWVTLTALLLHFRFIETTHGWSPRASVPVPSCSHRMPKLLRTLPTTSTDTSASLSTLRLAATEEDGEEKVGLWSRVKKYYSPPDDGLTFKQRLGKLGLSAALSYGWVSNMSYSVSVSLAWYIFSKRTGLSPLAPGQWKGFLATYAGFFVFNNFVRPIRMALAVTVSPAFDNFVNGIKDKLRINKAAAIGITVFLFNVVGTLAAMGAGILLASALAGVPPF